VDYVRNQYRSTHPPNQCTKVVVLASTTDRAIHSTEIIIIYNRLSTEAISKVHPTLVRTSCNISIDKKIPQQCVSWYYSWGGLIWCGLTWLNGFYERKRNRKEMERWMNLPRIINWDHHHHYTLRCCRSMLYEQKKAIVKRIFFVVRGICTVQLIIFAKLSGPRWDKDHFFHCM